MEKVNCDLYNKTRVTAKISAIIAVSKKCVYKVQNEIKGNIPGMRYIKDQFDEGKNQNRNCAGMQSVINELYSLCDWLLPHSNQDVQVLYIYEELYSLLAIAEQRLHLLKSLC